MFSLLGIKNKERNKKLQQPTNNCSAAEIVYHSYSLIQVTALKEHNVLMLDASVWIPWSAA